MAASGRNNPGTSWRSALQSNKTSTRADRRSLAYGMMDVLVIAACSLTFAAAIGSRHGEPKGPPFALIAHDLGTTPDAFRHAIEQVLPRSPAGPPTDAQKQQIASVLDVSVDRLESVMEKYRPDRLRSR